MITKNQGERIMARFSENFMNNLVRLRKQKNLTQQELADVLKVNKQQLSEFERGRRTPNFEVLDKIAEYFQASPNQLFGTSQEIELENAVMQSDGYSEKTQNILKSIKQITDFFNDEGNQDFIYQVESLVNPQPMYNQDGEALYYAIKDGIVDETKTYPMSYTQSYRDEMEFIQAFEKSALTKLREAREEGLL